MERYNSFSCNKIYWDNKKTSIAASAFCLIVSLVALALILTLGKSLTHHQFQVCLYTTIAFGSASLILLIVGCILKKVHFTKEWQEVEYSNGDRGHVVYYKVNNKRVAIKMGSGKIHIIRKKNIYHMSVEDDSTEGHDELNPQSNERKENENKKSNSKDNDTLEQSNEKSKNINNKSVDLENEYIIDDSEEDEFLKEHSEPVISKNENKQVVEVPRIENNLEKDMGERLQRDVQRNIIVMGCNSHSKITRIHQAIFTNDLSAPLLLRHADYPGHLFYRLCPKDVEAMKTAGNLCDQIINKNELNKCQILHWNKLEAKVANSDCYFLEREKEGMCGEKRRELYELELSPKECNKCNEDLENCKICQLSKNKWDTLFRQAAQFIAKTGYPCVDWDHLWIKEDCMQFINVPIPEPTNESKQKALYNLVALAPHFYNVIKEGAETGGVTLNLSLEEVNKWKAQLEKRLEIRKWQCEMKIQKSDQSVIMKVDNKKASKIIENFNKLLEDKRRLNKLTGAFIEDRILIDKEHAKELMQEALIELKMKKIIWGWDQIEERAFAKYVIYF